MDRLDLIDDARTNSGTVRAQNRAFLDPIIDKWFAGLTRHEAVERLNDAGVPTGPVHTAEDVFACPQVAARGMLMEIHDPDVGDYRFARTPPHLSAASELPTQSAPHLGQHTRPILSDLLGYDTKQIDELVTEGVVGVVD